MNAPVPNLTRRHFIVGSSAVTAGLAIGFDFPGVMGTATASTTANASAEEIGVWVVIQPNDTVVVRVVRSEMGQGTMTAIPMILAEDMELDWSRVRVVQAPA